MLNNKGQSLVLFVIILPIILFILVFVMDVGRAINLKYELINISNIVLDYGLDSMNDENIINDLEELVILNKSDIDNINVRVENEKIYIDLVDKYNGVLSSLVDISIFNINTSYVGYIENEKKRIENLGD